MAGSKAEKILFHPDKDLIIKKLLDGESLKSVEAWLTKKYPSQKRLKISWITLQKFRKEHLNLHGDLLNDIQNAKNGSTELAIKDALSKSTHYQDKINEIADEKLDVSRKLKEMDKIVSARMEFYYNTLASAEGGLKEDRMMLEYMREYRSILESWKKFIEGHADKKIEHNININVVNEQLNVLKGIVFEVLQEMDPMLVTIFVEKLNRRFTDINVGTEEYKRLTVIDAEVIDHDF